MSRRGAARAIPISLVLAVALLGFLSGHRSGERAEATREISIPGGSLHYPTSSRWRPTAGALALPALGLDERSALAPSGEGSRAALVVGQLPSRSPTVPAPFLAHARERPESHVVYLLSGEAYKYTDLELPGYDGAFTLYTIPSPPTRYTAIVCYAPAAKAREMGECERIAASLTPDLPVVGARLTPDPIYAHAVRVAIEGFDRLRATLRPEMSLAAPIPDRRALALRLAAGAAHAADSIAGQTPPLAVEGPHRTLEESLELTRKAYAHLAAVLARGSAVEYALARTEIDAAEKRVDEALANFGLLGYNST